MLEDLENVITKADRRRIRLPDLRYGYWRERKYVGGPPPARIKSMDLAHETRARKAGVYWEMVDLRRVYRAANCICGICHQPVAEHEFTIDHIIPISKGGEHVAANLQPAHGSCNSAKGNK